MVTRLQYWIGVGALAAFTMVAPVLLVLEGEPLEAAFIGLPAAVALAVTVALTFNTLPRGGA
jgi:hypothetical protein